MDLETRVSNLENLVNSLIKIINNNKFYSNADAAGLRQTSSDIQKNTDTNTEDINMLGDAILEMSEIIYQ